MRKHEMERAFALGSSSTDSARSCTRWQAHVSRLGQRSLRRLVMLIVDAGVGVSAAGIVHRCLSCVHFEFESSTSKLILLVTSACLKFPLDDIRLHSSCLLIFSRADFSHWVN